MLTMAATAVGAGNFPGCRHGRWQRGRHAARKYPPNLAAELFANAAVHPAPKWGDLCGYAHGRYG
jgi:hypothetical protein